MTLNRLCTNCKECPNVDDCNHKRMESLAYFKSTAENSPNLMTPVIKPEERTLVIMGRGCLKTNVEEEIKEMLNKEFGVCKMKIY